MAETYRLRLYADDGTTIAAEFSTDPAHAHPYLQVPENLVGQDIDFARGAAKISGCTVEVVDVPTNPADQDTGYLTGLLAGADGLTARIGRRAHLEVLIGAAYENVMNGVIDEVVLHDSYSSFQLTLKDQRENERRTRAFVHATTSSVSPRGVTDGFGYIAAADTWLVPPTVPHTCVYTELLQSFGSFDRMTAFLTFPVPPKDKDGRYVPPASQIMTTSMIEQFRLGPNFSYDRLRLLWRDVGTTPWNVLESPAADPLPFSLTFPGVFNAVGGTETEVQWLSSFVFRWPTETYTPRPTNSTTIEVIFGYNAEPSEEYPLHLEGLSFGELLQGLYDGDYSDNDAAPTVLYNSTAVLALTEPVFARITEPLDSEDGIWKWTEENIFAPLGAAPALDSQGRVSPIRYALPAFGAPLPQLDDSNCEPSPGWNHSGSDAVNVVSIEYPRLYHVPADRDPNGERSSGDGLDERKITIEHKHIGSIAFLGERPLRFKPVTLAAIGGEDEEPATGDVIDEFGAQLAKKRTREAIDRFLMGGQHFNRRVLRSVLAGKREGDWCLEATSWTPDYESGERGANRLAQIIAITPVDTQWLDVHLIDGGPDNAPVGQPTLGTLAVDFDLAVVVPITAIAAGSEARIDYAIGTSAPAADSPDWRFAGRIDVVGDVLTPAQPAGVTVWVRARGEKEGQRPSAYTTPVSIAVTQAPRVRRVRVTIDQLLGSAVVSWEPNLYAAGVRVHYGTGFAPNSFATVDADADDLSVTLPDDSIALGETLTVDVEPWSGWTGTAVSGTAGAKVRARAARNELPFFGPPVGQPQGRAAVLVKLELDSATNDLVLTVTKQASGATAGFSWHERTTITPEPDFQDGTAVFFDPNDDEDEVVIPLTDVPTGDTAYVTVWAFGFPRAGSAVGAIGMVGNTYKLSRRNDPAAPYIDVQIVPMTTVAYRYRVFVTVIDPDNLGGTLDIWTQNSILQGQQPNLAGAPQDTVVIASTPYTAGPSDSPFLTNLIASGTDSVDIQFKFTASDADEILAKVRVPPFLMTLDGFGQLNGDVVITRSTNGVPSAPLSGVSGNAQSSSVDLFANNQSYKSSTNPTLGMWATLGPIMAGEVSPYEGQPLSGFAYFTGGDLNENWRARLRIQFYDENGGSLGGVNGNEEYGQYDIDGAGSLRIKNFTTNEIIMTAGTFTYPMSVSTAVIPAGAFKAELKAIYVSGSGSDLIIHGPASLTVGALPRGQGGTPGVHQAQSLASGITASQIQQFLSLIQSGGNVAGIPSAAVVAAPVVDYAALETLIDTRIRRAVNLVAIDSDDEIQITQAAISDGAAQRAVMKGYLRDTAKGGSVSGSTWTDGDAVVYPANFQTAPQGVLTGGALQEFRRTLWTGAFDPALPQVPQREMVNNSPAGFTMRARLSQPSGTFTNRSDAYAGTVLDFIGETDAITIANAPAWNEKYRHTFDVTLSPGGDPGGGVVSPYNGTTTLVVAIESSSDSGSNWVERARRTFTATGEHNNESTISVAVDVTVTGLDSTDKFRLKIVDRFGDWAPGITGTAEAEGDACAYQTQSGTTIYASMTPEADDDPNQRINFSVFTDT